MIKTKTLATLATAVAISGLANPLLAQVEVVESKNRVISTAQPDAQPSSNAQAEMFFQLQQLQQEVQQLRGLVEEQSYELRRLKQQRLDDYLDLDRRLSSLVASGAAPAAGKSASSPPAPISDNTSPAVKSPAPSAPVAVPSQPDEMQSYRTAIDLVLKQKNYAEAATAFNRYLQQFPRGRYAPNSQYWLGEIHLLQGELEQSRQWFTRLLEEFPDHPKGPDAGYKLGTVYDKLGDKDKARELLQQVAAGTSNAARLANSYLEKL